MIFDIEFLKNFQKISKSDTNIENRDFRNLDNLDIAILGSCHARVSRGLKTGLECPKLTGLYGIRKNDNVEKS
jgi:hypothetical protein